VIDLLKRIAADHGATVLGVTHDPRLLSHADRVIELEDGNVVRDRRASDSNTTNNAKDNEHA
jgi:putative ABC transport system ATP-binding protein